MRTLTLYAARIAAALLPLLSAPTLTTRPSVPSGDGGSKPAREQGGSDSPAECDVEVMLGDGVPVLLVALMLVMDIGGGPVLFGVSVT